MVIMEKPKEIQHLISIGFKEIHGDWCPVWGQGDGEYYRCILKRGNDVIFKDRDTTLLKYRLNGVDITEKEILNMN